MFGGSWERQITFPQISSYDIGEAMYIALLPLITKGSLSRNTLPENHCYKVMNKSQPRRGSILAKLTNA